MIVPTRSFHDTAVARARQEPAFCAALFEEALQAAMDGDAAEARSLLCTFIEATVGFARLSDETQVPARSLMRMVGPRGNPRTADLLGVVRALQAVTGVRARVAVEARVDHPEGIEP